MYMQTHPHARHVRFINGDIDVDCLDFDAVNVREWDDENWNSHTLCMERISHHIAKIMIIVVITTAAITTNAAVV